MSYNGFKGPEEEVLYRSLQEDLKKYNELMSVKEVGSYLDVSIHTVYGYINRDSLPVRSISPRKKRILKSELIFWIIRRDEKNE